MVNSSSAISFGVFGDHVTVFISRDVTLDQLLDH